MIDMWQMVLHGMISARFDSNEIYAEYSPAVKNVLKLLPKDDEVGSDTSSIGRDLSELPYEK